MPAMPAMASNAHVSMFAVGASGFDGSGFTSLNL
jgi:hypothetical protein